jgi:predicted DNA-binding transcriptional regulator AlpA
MDDDAADRLGKVGIDTLHKIGEVKRATGWSASKIYAEVQAGRFDGPVKTAGSRGSAWWGSSLRKHQARLKSQSDKA